jgi:hypothetical protein
VISVSLVQPRSVRSKYVLLQYKRSTECGVIGTRYSIYQEQVLRTCLSSFCDKHQHTRPKMICITGLVQRTINFCCYVAAKHVQHGSSDVIVHSTIILLMVQFQNKKMRHAIMNKLKRTNMYNTVTYTVQAV